MKGIIIVLLAVARSGICHSLGNTRPLTMEEYLSHINEYSDALNKDGVWVKWEVSDSIIPINAVYGGYDASGTYYVMRADIREDNGHNVYRIVGKYDPLRKFASVGYNNKEYPVKSFELLLHNSTTWSGKDERTAIPGNQGSFICRFEQDFIQYWIPGRLGGDKYCRIVSDGSEMVSPGFESLKRACYRKGTQRQYERSTKTVVSHDELDMNHLVYKQSLSENGVWVYWNHNKIGVPSNAVFGGHTKDGPAFVMAADHFGSEGEYIGTIPGVYYPEAKSAYIVYNDELIKKKTFDLLLHDSYRWSKDVTNSNLALPAGHGFLFCSKGSEVGSWETRHPGRLDPVTKNCTIFHDEKVEVISSDYFVLIKAC